MNSKILFLAPYPTEANIKDGMISRVKAIDNHFTEVERTYLNVSVFRNLKKDQYLDGIVSVNNLNMIIHFWYILKILKGHIHIYSHSIYMLRFLWIFLSENKNIVLDLHGVVPEEERDFKKNYLIASYFSFIEKHIFKKLSFAVCVTHRMKDYYKKKYPDYKGKYLVYSIMPDFLQKVDDDDYQRAKLKNKDKIRILYSGGSQFWQNIDLMLDTIKNNQSDDIHYTILTGDLDVFLNKIKERNIDSGNISVVSRHPSELWKDYISADYAFILRDNNIVNNVANPTKLVEYLFYGLIPIVLSPHIGDYEKLGYEYMIINDFTKNILKPFNVSKNNIDIAKRLLNENQQLNLRQTLMET